MIKTSNELSIYSTTGCTLHVGTATTSTSIMPPKSKTSKAKSGPNKKKPSSLEQRLQKSGKNVRKNNAVSIQHDGGKLPDAWIEKLKTIFGSTSSTAQTQQDAFAGQQDDLETIKKPVVEELVELLERKCKTAASRKAAVLRIVKRFQALPAVLTGVPTGGRSASSGSSTTASGALPVVPVTAGVAIPLPPPPPRGPCSGSASSSAVVVGDEIRIGASAEAASSSSGKNASSSSTSCVTSVTAGAGGKEDGINKLSAVLSTANSKNPTVSVASSSFSSSSSPSSSSSSVAKKSDEAKDTTGRAGDHDAKNIALQPALNHHDATNLAPTRTSSTTRSAPPPSTFSTEQKLSWHKLPLDDLRNRILGREIPLEYLLLEENPEVALEQASKGLFGNDSPKKKINYEDTVPCPACGVGRCLRTFGKVPAGKMARDYIRYECLDCGRVTQVNE
ncbi:unnamed protein product [Amoebophrya sp. A120]|nr:unnamed protein product [Amoebophrya sp. A120]|eukprot:GSA120T00006958001.1